MTTKPIDLENDSSPTLLKAGVLMSQVWCCTWSSRLARLCYSSPTPWFIQVRRCIWFSRLMEYVISALLNAKAFVLPANKCFNCQKRESICLADSLLDYTKTNLFLFFKNWLLRIGRSNASMPSTAYNSINYLNYEH